MRIAISRRGVTLTELMVVLTILGVVAGLAVPNYFRTLEVSRSNEARANLNVIHMGQKIYKLNNNRYWPGGGGTDTTLSNINSNLNIDITTTFYTLSVTSGAGTGAAATYSATASRGNTGAKTFTITQAGTITESGSYG
ncbi:MAG TPA: prepilin-type N-terminal cleavage/methylation domain-containing protein [Candidatus Eisenbacteria bacterium]|nr:prepilin-type N-terminal cleavage/methylation domain-containing protein [Candidatus Eisenbacteria bacterium]